MPDAVAWVPVHPKDGPLWSMTTDNPAVSDLPSYPLMPLYADALTRLPLATPEMVDAAERLRGLTEVRDFMDWHDDSGDVLWWRAPIKEPPHYVGTPLDNGWPFDESEHAQLVWCYSMQPSTQDTARAARPEGVL